MKRMFKPVCLIALLLAPWVAAPAAASTALSTIGFDDIDLGGALYRPIAAGYAGLNWGANFFVLDSQRTPFLGTGYDKGTVSGDQVAFNGSGLPASFSTGAGGLDFYGVYMTSALGSPTTVEVRGTRAGHVVYDRMVTVGGNAARLFQFNYRGVDDVTFMPLGGGQIAFDDFQVSPVPEPEACALMAVALVGLLRRRRARGANETTESRLA